MPFYLPRDEWAKDQAKQLDEHVKTLPMPGDSVFRKWTAQDVADQARASVPDYVAQVQERHRQEDAQALSDHWANAKLPGDDILVQNDPEHPVNKALAYLAKAQAPDTAPAPTEAPQTQAEQGYGGTPIVDQPSDPSIPPVTEPAPYDPNGPPTSIGDAFKKAIDQQQQPDNPGLSMGPARLFPSKPVMPPQETQDKVLSDQPLDAQDFVSGFTKAAQSQQSTQPGAMEASGLDQVLPGHLAALAGGPVGGLGTPEEDIGRAAMATAGRGGEGGIGRAEAAAADALGGAAGHAGSVPPDRPPVFVPEDAFNINRGKNDKATAGDIRTELSGLRNAQIVRGNQLAEQVRAMAPEEQRALYWSHEAGGDADTLRTWAANPDPKLDPYRGDIEAALNLSPSAKRAQQLGEQYYTEMGQAGLDAGSIRNTLENYQNRIYKPEPPKDFVKTETASGISQSTGHAQQRVYDTAYDAVLGGKQFATTDYADSLAIHNEEMARVNANRQMAQAMQDTGLGKWARSDKVPEGWTQVGTLEKNVPIKDKDGQAVLGEDGNQLVSRSVFVAPEGIAKGLAAVADPNFLNKVDALRKVARFQGVVKTVDLSLSAFHHFTMGMQTIYQTLAQPSSLAQITKDLPRLTEKLSGGPFREFEQDFVRSGGITAKVQDNIDVLRSLREGDESGLLSKIADLPGVSTVAKVSDASTNFLFGKVQRYLKVMDYQNKITGWVAAHPDAGDTALVAAKRGYAREVNAAYGGLNWEQMGVSKAGLSAMRLALLAPDWTVSNLALAKYAVKGGTEGAAARAHLASALAAGTLLTEGTNYILTGHSSLSNPPGHEAEVQLGPHAYVSFFRGGIGDLIKLGSMMAESGPISGVARYAQGKASPVARTLIGGLANTDYNGRPIVNRRDGFLANTAHSAGYLAKSLLPVPLGASNTIGYLTSDAPNALGAAVVGTGIGRYSQGKEPGEGGRYSLPGSSRYTAPGPPKPPAPPKPPKAGR